MKKIGLLGCGAIGTQIALAIDSGKILNPGVYSYGGIHYYFLTFTSFISF